jgi:hypothetical protein
MHAVVTSGRLRVHAAACAAVLASSVAAAVLGGGATAVTLAGPQALRLIQQSAESLSSYPSLAMSVTVNVSISSRHQSLHEQIRSTPDGSRGMVTIELPQGGHSTILVVNRTLYAPAPAGRFPATAGKHWIGLSLTRATVAGSGAASGGKDGLGLLRLTSGAEGKVEIVGHEVVDGVPTTHYKVQLDLRRAIARTPPELRTTTSGQLAALGVTTMPVEVWLDPDHRIRQMTFRLDVRDVAVSARVRVRGASTPVSVPTPSPADTYLVNDISQFRSLTQPGCC